MVFIITSIGVKCSKKLPSKQGDTLLMLPPPQLKLSILFALPSLPAETVANNLAFFILVNFTLIRIRHSIFCGDQQTPIQFHRNHYSQKTSIKLFPMKMLPLSNSSICLCDLDTERIIPIPKMYQVYDLHQREEDDQLQTVGDFSVVTERKTLRYTCSIIQEKKT